MEKELTTAEAMKMLRGVLDYLNSREQAEDSANDPDAELPETFEETVRRRRCEMLSGQLNPAPEELGRRAVKRSSGARCGKREP